MSKDKRFVLSDTSSINSKGYRVDINGLDLTRFESNPVMLSLLINSLYAASNIKKSVVDYPEKIDKKVS